MIEAWFDGAVEPRNPGGHGGYGMLIKRDGQIVYSEAVYVGRWPTLSNNCTEYAGCIAVLRFLLREHISKAAVYGDADMIIKQVNGQWRAKSGAYIPYFQEARALRMQLPEVSLVWIPREQNAQADELSKIAVLKRPRVIDFHLDSTVEVQPVVLVPRKKRQRRRERFPRVREDEAYEMFKQRYGHL